MRAQGSGVRGEDEALKVEEPHPRVAWGKDAHGALLWTWGPAHGLG